MEKHGVSFDELEWQSTLPGARFKVFRDGAKQVRLVEFASEFVDAQWCDNGHIGFVLSGELEIEFSAGIERFPEGSTLFIPSGASHAHKARAVTSCVRLFLVEEASP
jgi:quercetin dioxygenase-like cupin family protein